MWASVSQVSCQKSQEYFGDFNGYKQQKSFIVASYVKSMESAGARVVPIFLDRDPEYYNTLVHSVNGILFPGGGNETGVSVLADPDHFAIV